MHGSETSVTHSSTKDNNATFNATVGDRNFSMPKDDFGAELYVEDYSLSIKICFAITGTITLITSIVAMTAMSRTRKIPRAAKFLAMGLLTFDSGFIIFSTVRKFVLNPTVNLAFMVAGTLNLKLSYVTIGMMTLERYLVLCHPHFYLRSCSESAVRKFAFVAWSVCSCTFLALRYGVCYLQHGQQAFIQAGTCNMLVTVYYSCLVLFVLCTAFPCYSRILRTIRRITGTTHRTLSFAVVFKNFKSTALVLVYFLVILVTSFAYIVILVFIRQFNLGISELRISLEVVNIINCFLDPYLYVLWFGETKMECLKLIAPFSERVTNKVEHMRTRIFDIVISEPAKFTAKVEPMKY